MEQRKLFRRKDLLFIAVLLIIAGIIWGVMAYLNQSKAGPYAEVIHDGKVATKVYLDQPGQFSVPGLPQIVFEVRDGAAAFIDSSCPDKICIHTGWLNRPGQTAACLPNRLMLVIDGGADRLDTVAG